MLYPLSKILSHQITILNMTQKMNKYRRRYSKKINKQKKKIPNVCESDKT